MRESKAGGCADSKPTSGFRLKANPLSPIRMFGSPCIILDCLAKLPELATLH